MEDDEVHKAVWAIGQIRERSNRGEGLLRHVQWLEPRLDPSWKEVFRLWEDKDTYYGFSQKSIWSVFKYMMPEEKCQPWLREVVWDRGADFTRLRSLDAKDHAAEVTEPKLSLTVRDVLIPSSSVDVIERWAEKLDVPIVCHTEQVSSGVFYFGMDILFFAGATRLEWCSDEPTEWRTIIQAANRFREYFQKCMGHAPLHFIPP